MTNINPNIESSISQNRAILEYLLAGNTITSLEAVGKFGCMRLASRIFDIRETHPEVQGRMITAGNGKRVMEYYINQSQN